LIQALAAYSCGTAPRSTAAREVWAWTSSLHASRCEQEGRFPEAKELKQRVRDVLDPDFSLGRAA